METDEAIAYQSAMMAKLVRDRFVARVVFVKTGSVVVQNWPPMMQKMAHVRITVIATKISIARVNVV